MKTSTIILALSLTLSAFAAPQDNGRQQGGSASKNNAKSSNNNGGVAGSTNNTGTDGINGGASGTGNSTGTSSGTNGGDPQTSLTLDPKVIATGFANDGQDVPTAGQVSSLTSTNNFINFCLTVSNLPLTDGKQITTGSCNPAPMGVLPSTDNMPSCKFTSPKNGDVLKENTPFTISMAIQNLQTGAFVNAAENYFSAPQQLSSQGAIVGHSHVVVETLAALDQTTPLDPKKFAFFKGLNAPASGGILTADVTSGLPAGFYKLSSINSAANHQPVLVPIAQHGSLDDAVYFTVTANGTSAQAPNGAAVANGTVTTGNISGGAGGKGQATSAAANGTPSNSPATSSSTSRNQNGGVRGRRMVSRIQY